MDSDDDFDPDFFSAVDQLVAQHKSGSTQAPLAHQRGSQPPSPVQPPPAARQQQGPPPPQGGPGFRPQQQYGGAPLQQINGNGGAGYGGGQAYKPPQPPASRQQQPMRAGPPAVGGVPPGRVSMAAAELQAQAAAAGPVQQAQWQGGAGDPVGQLQQVQAELNRSLGQNKLLASNMQQKEREVAALRQKLAALERGGAGAGAGAAGGPGAGPPQQRSAFAVTELQKQVDSLRQQLLFKDQEMDDIKRQLSTSSEKQKAAEATAAELQARLRHQAPTVPAAGQQQASGAAVDAAAVAQGRPGSAGRTPSTSAAPGQRSSGKKRRQSAGPSGAGVAGGTAAAATAAGAEDNGSAPAQPAAATAAAPLRPPLLDPAVLAAASSFSSSTALVSQLMAACSSSMALLAGAAPEAAAQAEDPAAQAAAPSALLLRSRLAAAARASDADSLQFVAFFSQRVQQVACGMLPPAALLDSIAALAAASLAQLHAGGAAAAAGGPAAPAHPSGNGGLPEQRLRLLAAGLHVAQHLIELDAGCAVAAVAAAPVAPGGSLGGSLVAAPPRLSGRVTLLSSSGAAVPAPALPGCSWPALSGGGGGSAGLPSCGALLQQHAAAFEGLASPEASPLLPVVLGAALELGELHEAIGAGALGVLLAMARALRREGARAVLVPVFMTGAMERFMQPPALRLQALSLLQLLLEEPSLAGLFESSLSHAAAARCEPGPPTATAGTSGNGGGSSTPQGPAAGGRGGEAMQVEDGGGRAPAGGPWTGAAEIAERLLDSFSLDIWPQPAAEAQQGASSGAAAAAAAGGGAEACGIAARAAVARAAMSLVAALREARQHGILIYLLLDDACGAPGGMLAERLVQLAESALAIPGEEGAMMLLCPLPWPEGAGGGGDGLLLRQQADWQQRLRVAQEALTLLRGLLLDESCAVAALDDLVCIPSTARVTLTTLSRLSRLEAPAAAGGAAAAAAAGVTPATISGGAASQQAAAAGLAAPPPPPALLAPWARAIGSSTEQAAIGDPVTGSCAGGAPASPGALPSCSVEDMVYMARGVRRRVLARMQNTAAMQQG
ncbi:hypothetical protein ABPG75_009024 [Micractinium tetrahymenae]